MGRNPGVEPTSRPADVRNGEAGCVDALEIPQTRDRNPAVESPGQSVVNAEQPVLAPARSCRIPTQENVEQHVSVEAPMAATDGKEAVTQAPTANKVDETEQQETQPANNPQ